MQESNLTIKDKDMLAMHAKSIRRRIISMLVTAKSGHTAGPLGLSDIYSFLFGYALMIPKHEKTEDRDRFILSNGHVNPVYYSALIEFGYIDDSLVGTLRKFGSPLQGHPHREFLPILETSSGPLGSGISQGVGMALAMRIKGNTTSRVVIMTGDGELNEGNNWEGIMLGAREKLSNVCVIVDRNGIQIDGNTEDVLPLEPLPDKWRAFGWNVIECSGHDFDALSDAWEAFKICHDKPTVIIAYTVPGRGVSFIEGDFHWHGKAPSKEEAEKALGELV